MTDHFNSMLVRSTFLACLSAMPFIASPTNAEEARLLVNLKEIRDAIGDVRVSLYREPETFRKEDRAVKVVSTPAVKGELQVVFEGLPAGRYAIMAYHDENSDGKLNLRLGMFPTEGYGLSNNPQVIGPPRFAESAFDVAGPETSISIELSY